MEKSNSISSIDLRSQLTERRPAGSLGVKEESRKLRKTNLAVGQSGT